MYFIVTTPVNRQYDGMWETQWAVGECKVTKTRYKGLFLLEAGEDAAEKIRKYETTAVYRVIPLNRMVGSSLTEILEESVRLAEEKLKKGETFAVRCKRRGFHITGKEIEQKVGAKVVENLGNPVNLSNPDKVVLIEIIDARTGISVLREEEIVKKEAVDI